MSFPVQSRLFLSNDSTHVNSTFARAIDPCTHIPWCCNRYTEGPLVLHADEPTSGLDARSAAIVMRVVRAIVDTNRTIVCTIHQPSTEIFLNFDDLLLLKRGGWPIYYGPLGEDANDLVTYLKTAAPAVKDLARGYNPATWMLEVGSGPHCLSVVL